MAEIITPWYPGLYGDHLYATCPALRKTAIKFSDEGEPVQGGGDIGDPYDYSVCGWCRRVHRARHPLGNDGRVVANLATRPAQFDGSEESG
jgi:hypothetical protein